MPGKNSLFDEKRDKCLTRWIAGKVCYYIIFFVIFLETWGIIRYGLMWENRRWTFDTLFWICFFTVTDFLIFHAMWVTK